MTDRKLRQYAKFLPVTLVAQVALAALIFVMLLKIVKLVHVKIYSHGSQFSNTYALPYWTFHRFALRILLLIIGLNGFLIAYIIHGQRNQ